MAGANKLLTAGGGGVILAPATSIASDVTVQIPSSNGTIALQETKITSGTAVASTSGTSIDFTSIPSWVKRITVMFNGVSTNGSSLPLVQLGDAGGIETTGYVSLINGPGSGLGQGNSTAGFLLNIAGNTLYVLTGHLVITQVSGNTYVSTVVTSTDAAVGNYSNLGAGRKTLSDTLTQLRITTVNGTDTFDAGSINILYE